MKLESLVQYLDAYLGVPEHPDYPTALNGLQVAAPAEREVRRLAGAVDASLATIDDAVASEADLLVVHHGLFWSGLEPLTGRHYSKVRALMKADVALYSAHLPLDGHPEIGNAALLASALNVTDLEPFARYEGADVGWLGTLAESASRDVLARRVAGAVDPVGNAPVRVLAGGPDAVRRVAVVTGGGGSFIGAAVDAGADALVTGEGSHHTFVEATELGLNVYYAGHYATETFGVKALCRHAAERFGLEWSFLDHPSGL